MTPAQIGETGRKKGVHASPDANANGVADASREGPAKNFFSGRIAVLSDMIFAVAITSPVFSLLFLQSNAYPDWRSVLEPMLRPLVAVGCSFLFSGMFWISHHRRLALTEAGSRRYLFITFAFLFLVVLLPVPTILWGHGEARPWTTVLYSSHLAAIACVNEVLWLAIVAAGPARRWRMAAAPGVLAIVFLLAAGVSATEPHFAPLNRILLHCYGSRWRWRRSSIPGRQDRKYEAPRSARRGVLGARHCDAVACGVATEITSYGWASMSDPGSRRAVRTCNCGGICAAGLHALS